MSNRGPARPKGIPVKSLSVKVEAGVGMRALLYAEKRRTNISIIVEEALREYIKARAGFLSDIPFRVKSQGYHSHFLRQ
ncbi:MAG: hypothetical protein AB2L14_01235 [Candidatus Xenobiia bacterium LiM19]